MGRGLPAQAAEDAVFESWEAAVDRFDPSRGPFDAYLMSVLRNRCAYWWRTAARDDRAHAHLRLVPTPDEARETSAWRNQVALLDALEPGEREVFAAWALQKHLGKGAHHRRRLRARDRPRRDRVREREAPPQRCPPPHPRPARADRGRGDPWSRRCRRYRLTR
jgi:hypothetical protein